MNQNPNTERHNGNNKMNGSQAINKGINKADKFMNETADKAGSKMDDLRDDAEGFVSSLSDGLKDGATHLGDVIGEKAQQLRDRFDSRLENGKEMMHQVSDAAGEVETNVRDFVSRRPLTTVAIAAGIGFIAGKILSRSAAPKSSEKYS